MRKEKALPPISDNHLDDHVDESIASYLLKEKKSFLLFAGAGSGKTRSLIKALNAIVNSLGESFSRRGQHVAVITYTNVACDEILRRANYNPIFHVSTIHSFLWEQIKNYPLDIKEWVKAHLDTKIEELESKFSKARNDKTRINYKEEIEKIKQKLIVMDEINKFIYSPTGENNKYNSLSHSQVIQIGCNFLQESETMQKILINKYPIILIDESQDTKKELIDALLKIYQTYGKKLVVGMFGDNMQKIYSDGKNNLTRSISTISWGIPVKKMNHRSAKRIVKLANEIRKDIDGIEQKPRSDAVEGYVRLFLADCNETDKATIEKKIVQRMEEITVDLNWEKETEYKSLILEHHMAASRLDFNGIYEPLNAINKFSDALKDGTIPELQFLTDTILPLKNAYNNEDDFGVVQILKSKSNLIDDINTNLEQQSIIVEKYNNFLSDFFILWNDTIPSCLEVYKKIAEGSLFTFQNRVEHIINEENMDEDIVALRTALNSPFTQLENYYAYIKEQTSFATHQGVKGLEFPAVMVIMDDSQAKGFLFSYEKLFGAKEKTDTDLKNENEGKDTSVLRTKRLFYVACTRAEKGLAVVAYTSNKSAVRETAIANGWFTEDEIEEVSC